MRRANPGLTDTQVEMILADHPHWKRFAGPLVILALGLWPALRSWALGPDVQVDFGRELYVPWRISEGAGLYRDIAYFNGPLSVYWHALWFKIAGVGLTTLKTLNLVTTIGMTVLIVKLARRTSGSYAAYAAAAFFVGAIAFGQILTIGNYDYLTPYSHELTHGIALSLWGLFEFARRKDVAQPNQTMLRCGAILALVFLTKMEVFAALGFSLFAGFALDWAADISARSSLWPKLGNFTIGFAAVIAIAFVALSLSVGAESALHGIIEPARAILGTDVAGLTYYRWVMGTRDVADSLSKIGIGLGVYALAFVGLVVLSRLWRRGGLERFNVFAALVLIAACITFPIAPAYAVNAIRPLAVIVPALFCWLIYLTLKQKRSDLVLPACALAFGFGLQAKMFLNTQFGHYGFALLMPSTLVLIAALLGWLPRWVEGRGGSAVFFRLMATAMLLSVALGLNARTEQNAARRNEQVGQGADAMMSDFRADDVLRALYFLEGTNSDATVAVLPEGVMLNYLSRRINPTPYINFMPPEFSLYGDNAIVDAFRENPPDYILFVHKRTGLYGFPFFGKDYGQELYVWANANYHMVRQIGDRPFEEQTRFGITVLERGDAVQ